MEHDGRLNLPICRPWTPESSDEQIEEDCRHVWFAAWREIHRRSRDLYPEYVDVGGEG